MKEFPRYWKMAPLGWLLIAAAFAIVGILFFDSLQTMVNWWNEREEYSHGYLIPIIAAYLVWQRSDQLREIEFNGSWTGVLLSGFALFLYLVGELATVYTIIQYAFVLFVLGLAWATLGTAAFRVIAVPLCLLFFMVPFPNFIYNSLSSKLQLLSSEIGVMVIRAFGIGVFLEGNVIDLGSYKLQVIEACNGLRYLFPLMTLGVIVAYFYHAALWKRVLIFVSTVPITILMNSFRIGVIGVMVEYWGQSMAEGFLHDFEGWAIFMVCFAILFLEMWLLMRLSKDQRPLREVFGIDPPIPAVAGVPFHPRPISRPAVAVLVLTMLTLIPGLTLPKRTEVPPQRESFTELPVQLEQWKGRVSKLETIYLDALKLTDYALVDFTNPGGSQVNFYAAYYESQRKGQSAHSPKSCLPGGGWVMEQFGQRMVEGVTVEGVPLVVNRVVIAQGESRQLVYYWFQQRGRLITNEYLVKWYVFWDGLTKNRSDGALVRLVTPLREGEDLDQADALMRDFVGKIAGQLPRFIPD
jgi:exosortase D (VPLPA-CTERM-specific)